MRVSWQQRTDRQWIGLVMLGALIIMAIVLLQGVVMAAQPGAEGQGVAREADDVSIRVLTGARDSRIGVSIEDVEASEATGSPEEGAHVTDVRDETPASMAGIEAGDVIVEFDGERVRSARQLSRLVRETPAGRQVSAVVMRDGRRVTLEVTPEAGPGWMAAFEEHLPGLERLRENWTAYVPDMGRMRRELDPGEAFTVEVTRERQVIVLDGLLEGRRPRGRDLEAI